MLELRNVETFYGNIRALAGISLTIGKGEIVALIGSNGAGKSTALMTISGIVPLRSGSIIFENQAIDKKTPDEIVSLGISQAPEGRRIFSQLSVQENLNMGAFLRIDKTDVKNDMNYIFELFPVLYQRRHQQGGTLSGGEQQMLAISRAMMARPKLLLLDEPSLGLSPIFTETIFQIIRKINEEQNTTILLVEQNAYMALNLASRAYVMETGSIILEGNAQTLLADENVKRAYLGI
jgi:branched-chain amino acid transport system ATP-binding protein